MSSPHSVTAPFLECTSVDKEVRKVCLSVQVKTTKYTEILSQLGRKDRPSKHSDCLKTTQQSLARTLKISLWWTKVFSDSKSMGTHCTMLRKEA